MRLLLSSPSAKNVNLQSRCCTGRHEFWHEFCLQVDVGTSLVIIRPMIIFHILLWVYLIRYCCPDISCEDKRKSALTAGLLKYGWEKDCMRKRLIYVEWWRTVFVEYFCSWSSFRFQRYNNMCPWRNGFVLVAVSGHEKYSSLDSFWIDSVLSLREYFS